MEEGDSCAETGVHAVMQANPIISVGADIVEHKWLLAATQYQKSHYTFRIARKAVPRTEVGKAMTFYSTERTLFTY